MFIGQTPNVDGSDAPDSFFSPSEHFAKTVIFKSSMQYVKIGGHVYDLICANYVKLQLARIRKHHRVTVSNFTHYLQKINRNGLAGFD
jgi:hypothetical protein